MDKYNGLFKVQNYRMKSVAVKAMEAYRRYGNIDLPHSYTRTLYGGTSCQLHAPATFPQRKQPPVPYEQETGRSLEAFLMICRRGNRPPPTGIEPLTAILIHYANAYLRSCYRGADKSLVRPERKQARKHVRDARDFNIIETRTAIKVSFFFLHGKAPKEIHAILTETLACFPPGRAKDLSALLWKKCRKDTTLDSSFEVGVSDYK